MNERIKELANQAGYKDLPTVRLAFQGFDKEKFAELIVRECINLVEPTEEHRAWAQGYLGGVDGLELLDSKVKKIKQNFGVGE